MPIRAIKDDTGCTLYIDEDPPPFWCNPRLYGEPGWGHDPDADLMHYYDRLNSLALCGFLPRPDEVYPDGWSNCCPECESLKITMEGGSGNEMEENQ